MNFSLFFSLKMIQGIENTDYSKKIGNNHYVPENFGSTHPFVEKPQNISSQLNELPDFAKYLFLDKKIPEEDKDLFQEDFLLKYMDDLYFRETTEGQYIYLIREEKRGIYHYYGVGDELIVDEKLQDIPGARILRIKVESKVTVYPFYTLRYQTTNDANVGFAYSRCGIVSNNEHFSESYNRLIDTGASYSTIPFMDRWNYDLREYSQENVSSSRYSLNVSELKNNIRTQDIIPLSGLGNMLVLKIIWKIPILFSIDGLPPIRVSDMIVPLEKIDDFYILGIDILRRHTLIMSSTNMKTDIKILPSERINNTLSEEMNITITKTSVSIGDTFKNITGFSSKVSSPSSKK